MINGLGDRRRLVVCRIVDAEAAVAEAAGLRVGEGRHDGRRIGPADAIRGAHHRKLAGFFHRARIGRCLQVQHDLEFGRTGNVIEESSDVSGQ